jgi:hypothetical protein
VQSPSRSANRYVLTSAGLPLPTGPRVALLLAPVIVGVPVLAILGSAAALLRGNYAAVCALAVLGGFCALLKAMRFWVLRGSEDAIAATAAWDGGRADVAFTRAQAALALAVRSDIRMRSLQVLGLVAEARADFREADELLSLAERAIPGLGGARSSHARFVILAHRAIVLTAMGRVGEADAALRAASAAFALLGPGRPCDALVLVEDPLAAFASAISVSKIAPRDIEIPRAPRALLALASAVVLFASRRPTEALDLLRRERQPLGDGVWPRERCLLNAIESRANDLLAGPFRASTSYSAPLDGDAAWARCVLATCPTS